MSKVLIGNIKGPKGDTGNTGATGPKGDQGIQGPTGPAGGVNSVNGKKGDVTIADALGYTPVGGENLLCFTKDMPMKSKAYIEFNRSKRTVDDDGFAVAHIDADGSYSSIALFFKKPITEMENKKVTISAYVKSSGLKTFSEGFQISCGVYASSNHRVKFKGLGSFSDGRFYNITDFEDNKWVLLKTKNIILPLESDMSPEINKESAFKYGIQFFVNSNNSEHPLEIKKIKVEFGDVLNPVWTPNPQDFLMKNDDYGRNLFVMSTATNGTFLNGNNTSGSGYTSNERTSQYIPVVENERITIQWKGTVKPTSNYLTYWIRVMWFDSDKQELKSDFLSNIETSFSDPIPCDVWNTFTAPSNAAYLRVSARFYQDGKIKVERGDTPTEWSLAPEDMYTLGNGNPIDTILNNYDLNAITTPGSYSCMSSTIATTLKNRPNVTVGFRLDVIAVTQTSFVQRIMTHSTGGIEVFYRAYSNGTFSNWYKVNMTQVTTLNPASDSEDSDMRVLESSSLPRLQSSESPDMDVADSDLSVSYQSSIQPNVEESDTNTSASFNRTEPRVEPSTKEFKTEVTNNDSNTI